MIQITEALMHQDGNILDRKIKNDYIWNTTEIIQ